MAMAFVFAMAVGMKPGLWPAVAMATVAQLERCEEFRSKSKLMALMVDTRGRDGGGDGKVSH